jgi:GNAT superfamily N-acetyltransferase
MTETPPAAPDAQPGTWRVRAAREQDVAAVAAAVAELLVELGGTPAGPAAMQDATRTLIDHPDAGAVLVATLGDELLGVLAASWQTAIHVPGRYALIQDLWVQPPWRGRQIGGELLLALCELASERQIGRVEVGLPRASFAGRSATEAFYLSNGFARLGPRMQRNTS